MLEDLLDRANLSGGCERLREAALEDAASAARTGAVEMIQEPRVSRCRAQYVQILECLTVDSHCSPNYTVH